MSSGLNWYTLSPMQRESLHMVANKIARIVVGNPDFKDHWDDIAGYARLISREMEDETSRTEGAARDAP
jgi:hypothetical protein